MIHSSLITSNTRVAPIKRQTIPRLELCGALSLSQLIMHVKTVLDRLSYELLAWSDSMVVGSSWLDSMWFPQIQTVRWQPCDPFAGDTTPQIWRYVNTSDNPADCASQGLFPSGLIQHELWWNGLRVVVSSNRLPYHFSWSRQWNILHCLSNSDNFSTFSQL